LPASPGHGCDWLLKGGRGYFDVGSSSGGAEGLPGCGESGEPSTGDAASDANPTPIPPNTVRRLTFACSFMFVCFKNMNGYNYDTIEYVMGK
jgi:hypothetical protein